VEYVISELEEKDREEFFRLKRVQDKKKIRRDAPTGDGPTYFA
jgi:vacuolar-type H+-ATPase subunit D/Vma8